MHIRAPWNDRLAEPLSKEHLVQIYRDERILAEAVSLYAGRGLGKGEAVVLVATAPHLQQIEARLKRAGFEVEDLKAWGQLIPIDAGRLLARLMVDGAVEAERFRSTVADIIAGVRDGGRFRKVRIYGEMVNLLWRQNHPATHRLEELWNETIEAHCVSLLCGYHVGDPSGEPHLFPRDLQALHSHLIPLEAGA